MVGGNPKHDVYGFRFWNEPGAFAEDLVSGAGGRLCGVVAAVVRAGFTICGPEYLSMIAAETANPRPVIRRAYKTFLARVLLFFVGGALCIGIVIPYDDPTLATLLDAGVSTGAASPYVISMQRLGIAGLGSVVNAGIMISLDMGSLGLAVALFAGSAAGFGELGEGHGLPRRPHHGQPTPQPLLRQPHVHPLPPGAESPGYIPGYAPVQREIPALHLIHCRRQHGNPDPIAGVRFIRGPAQQLGYHTSYLKIQGNQASTMDLTTLLTLLLLSVAIYILRTIYTTLTSPLSPIPGPKLFALTKWRLALQDYRGTRTTHMQSLHSQYGDAVRIGPNEVSFNTLSALRTIYGAGTVFQRTDFYRMFDVYGRPCRPMLMKTERKRLLNHAYSKTSILSPTNAAMIEEKTRLFLELVAREADGHGNLEIFNALHYFSLDSITAFLYGKGGDDKAFARGPTSALSPASADRSLLNDIVDPARRNLSWFTIHFPALTGWLYTRAGLLNSIITSLDLLPMRRPSTYSGIRNHALQAAQEINEAATQTGVVNPDECITERLLAAMQREQRQGKSKIDLLGVAAEAADHLLAGIDTTADTLMWAIFLLSRPENRKYQDTLRAEIRALHVNGKENGSVDPVVADKLPYLDAVIKETLRLFAPLPGTEPRLAESDTVIDGYVIPAGTVGVQGSRDV
ncbi:uncharacterized protein DSM5745_10299 [Aspergillus mulundensis]|uniref:Amino acid permease/ SLC12A domain-containing protein n=1 Tax=Aspergillus mulundensis TaxID=1810919 RepID=A0A3D8QNC6_9EURO|nr:hypothetical protein DSM5745_10299 [Aspergillus mulundensis]RDW63188.1 hypothetical protein DSM5745_10299 [Aspergillus mulundensis]